jgi:ketosteroid isomerase-like protein
MSSREEIENLVTRFHETRNTLNVDETMACIDGSCTFRVVGTDALGALTSVADTPEKLRGAAEAFLGTWDLGGLRNVSIYVDGDTAFVHRAGTATYMPTGTTIDTEIMEKIVFKNGLVVEYQQFADTYLIAKTMGIGHF